MNCGSPSRGRSSTARFGGVTVVLAGDSKQCLPVIPKSSPTQIVDACIMNADFWGEVEVLHLSFEQIWRPKFRTWIRSTTWCSTCCRVTLKRSTARIRSKKKTNHCS
ncbi:BQ5605_C008g04926 [Microbotryum silenes-dioicae]|uniref:ATP-dependent DNA helicase n=1 Tax=Microbotryum silenes-dioicae TaxID=796604 RepID=A0A2X0MBI4_9BASI|nr:BQ5605_C008g04926 [Microbotryum silenes-dioicae]